MLALWYTVLSYKEYRDTILDKLSTKKSPPPKETAVVCPLPSKKNEPPSKKNEPPSKIPIVEPPKQQRSLPTPPPTPPTPQPKSIPKPKTPEIPVPQQKMEPPPKPPRAPSPHPIMTEALDDIDYEEESEESEPDEEDSVLATPQFQRKPVSKSVNEFIDREKM